MPTTTYRQLLRHREFVALFASTTAHTAAQTLASLALGVLVYGRSGSPLLSSLAMFGPALAQLLGAATVLSGADRLPPRRALSALAAVSAAATAVQALPGLPLWAVFAPLLPLGLAGCLAGGVRYGLLDELLSRDGYLLGRSLLNASTGVVQILAFAAGAALTAALTPGGTLLLAAACHLLAAATARTGLARRPARRTGAATPAATWSATARLWSDRERRRVYLALWVPGGLIVGAESLFVPYDPAHAGLLLAASAAGMLTGDALAARFLPARLTARLTARLRGRLAMPLCALLAGPYLAFGLRPPLPAGLALAAVAALGYASGLLLQQQLLDRTPGDLTGHALGLHTSGMLAFQGLAATAAGAAAQVTSPATAMSLTAAASLAATALLWPRDRRAGSRIDRAYTICHPHRW
ncbi:MFS transporter [Kitasatospora sp. NPDC051170]|uniref:MFS transporter n=1 Tax=Kitasatospora sp. NPDC051170 TaxID=3364056 RepID=UPI0037A0E830